MDIVRCHKNYKKVLDICGGRNKKNLIKLSGAAARTGDFKKDRCKKIGKSKDYRTVAKNNKYNGVQRNVLEYVNSRRLVVIKI